MPSTKYTNNCSVGKFWVTHTDGSKTPVYSNIKHCNTGIKAFRILDVKAAETLRWRILERLNRRVYPVVESLRNQVVDAGGADIMDIGEYKHKVWEIVEVDGKKFCSVNWIVNSGPMRNVELGLALWNAEKQMNEWHRLFNLATTVFIQAVAALNLTIPKCVGFTKIQVNNRNYVFARNLSLNGREVWLEEGYFPRIGFDTTPFQEIVL